MVELGVSIRQLAELAGVSRGTVDRAINNRPGIDPKVREQILHLASKHGYRSNRAGRALGLHKSPLKIGIQMPADGNDFFLDVRRGIDQAADELSGFCLKVIVRTMKGFSVERQVDQIEVLLSEGIQALALVPIDQPAVRGLLDQLALPVITLNTDVSSGRRLSYIGNDYLHSGCVAAGILGLAAAGRPMETLVFTGSRRVLGHNQRISGFRETLRQHYPHIRILNILENQDDDMLSAQLMEQALQAGPPFQAVYLTAGGVAGACEVLQRHMMAGSVKVICFDPMRRTEPYIRSGLITAAIGQDPFRQGYEAVKRLFDFLLDGTVPPRRIIMKNEIFIREHCLVSLNPANQNQAVWPKEDTHENILSRC